MTSNASGPDAVSLNAGYVVRRLVVGIAAGTRCPRQARPRQGRVAGGESASGAAAAVRAPGLVGPLPGVDWPLSGSH
jgi:hypothetical protein